MVQRSYLIFIFCPGRGAAMDDEGVERRKNTIAAVTPATQLRTDPGHLQLAFEQEVMDTKL